MSTLANINEIKFNGNKAYKYSRMQSRWFPITMNIAKQMIEEGQAKIYNPMTFVK
jgi:hypothetical protein